MRTMPSAFLAAALASSTLLLAPAARAADDHAGHDHSGHAHAAPASSGGLTAVRDARIPAGEEQARDALERSPRHGEYVDIPLGEGQPALRTWVSYPEKSAKAGVVLIIHEIFGLSDWIRALADQIASDGYIAVAPDLISGMGPGGGGTDSTKSRDEVVGLIRSLTPEIATARLDAAFAYATKIPASNGKVATIGFCWGGSRSFAYATTQPALKGAVVYYGSSPDSAALASIHAPVVGFYGGDDARVNASIEPAKAQLARAGKTYEVTIIPGAGHGFLRQQSGREGANLKATQQAWPKTLAFFAKVLK